VRILATLLMCLLLAGCGGYTIEHREVGYRGKAKLDAYLAAARFLENLGYDVVSKPGWPKLDQDVGMLIVPAEVISTEAYKREISQWVIDGGHLLCLVEWGESYHDEWRGNGASFGGDDEEAVPKVLGDWLKDAGLTIDRKSGDKLKAEHLRASGKRYEVFAESSVGVSEGGKSRKVFGQAEYGQGLITVMADARPFRNRHIGDYDHAALLLSLAEASPYRGQIVIVRDAAISLWSLIWRHGWPALLGLIAVTLFWLWKNMPRFGPLRREEERSTVRDYDHHLEALGDFQWRLDKGAAMLRPLRDSVIERAQRIAYTAHQGTDLFEWIAQRASITRDRAERAMTLDRPADPASFTRVLADLQKIHLSLT
jgi:hypothetical protein